MAIAGADGSFNGHVLETILVSTLGKDDWRGLFDGSVGWDDERVAQGLDILNRVWDYTLPDYLSITWGDINNYFTADDGPAMMVMGDWTQGVLKSMKFTDYKWAPSPGTEGLFVVLSDSFGLPKNAPHRENALNWLKVVGSKEGQDAFNPPKGSIPARTDADQSLYDDYQHTAMADFTSNTLVPSLQHGAAAKQSFLNDYDLAVNQMLASRDVAATQALMVQAAGDAEFGA
jgi:glucose/mannose transport system substrate-binding protein